MIELAKSVGNRLEVQRALATVGRTHFCHAEALTTNNRLLYDQALDSSKKSYQKSLQLCEKYKPLFIFFYFLLNLFIHFHSLEFISIIVHSFQLKFNLIELELTKLNEIEFKF